MPKPPTRTLRIANRKKWNDRESVALSLRERNASPIVHSCGSKLSGVLAYLSRSERATLHTIRTRGAGRKFRVAIKKYPTREEHVVGDACSDRLVADDVDVRNSRC